MFDIYRGQSAQIKAHRSSRWKCALFASAIDALTTFMPQRSCMA
jgi:hypothetical protein